jgi:hypothetical protein
MANVIYELTLTNPIQVILSHCALPWGRPLMPLIFLGGRCVSCSSEQGIRILL